MKNIVLLLAIVAITCTEALDSNVIPTPLPVLPQVIIPKIIEAVKPYIKKVFSVFQNDGDVKLQIAPFVIPLITTAVPIVWDIVKKVAKW